MDNNYDFSGTGNYSLSYTPETKVKLECPLKEMGKLCYEEEPDCEECKKHYYNKTNNVK